MQVESDDETVVARQKPVQRHEEDPEVILLEGPGQAHNSTALGCRDEVDVVLDWASKRDKKRVRRYLETADVADGKWSLTRFQSDACAWPAAATSLMYGARAARVCTVAKLVGAKFHFTIEQPPTYDLVLELLRKVDSDAMRTLKSVWGGSVSDNDGRMTVGRHLESHQQIFNEFFWAGERIAAPGSEDIIAFTSLRPEDVVYVVCSIGKRDGDVVFILEAIHFIARSPKYGTAK